MLSAANMPLLLICFTKIASVYSDETVYKMCGTDLLLFMKIACEGCFYNEDLRAPSNCDFTPSNFNNNQKRTPGSHGGITDECCHASCTMSQIKRYCCTFSGFRDASCGRTASLFESREISSPECIGCQNEERFDVVPDIQKCLSMAARYSTTREEAGGHCKRLGGQLAYPTSMKEAMKMASIAFVNSYSYAWIQPNHMKFVGYLTLDDGSAYDNVGIFGAESYNPDHGCLVIGGSELEVKYVKCDGDQEYGVLCQPVGEACLTEDSEPIVVSTTTASTTTVTTSTTPSTTTPADIAPTASQSSFDRSDIRASMNALADDWKTLQDRDSQRCHYDATALPPKISLTPVQSEVDKEMKILAKKWNSESEQGINERCFLRD